MSPAGTLPSWKYPEPSTFVDRFVPATDTVRPSGDPVVRLTVPATVAPATPDGPVGPSELPPQPMAATISARHDATNRLRVAVCMFSSPMSPGVSGNPVSTARRVPLSCVLQALDPQCLTAISR